MGEENNTNGTPQETNTPPQEEPTTPKYSIEDVVKELGIEAILADPTVNAEVLRQRDRHTTQAINTARTRWEQEATRKQAEAEDEASRLAHMSAEERERYQLKKDREALDKERAEFNRRNLVLETSRQMLDAGLPDLADYVAGKDADETAQNISKVTDILGAWKASQLNDAMRGTTPRDPKPSQTYKVTDLKGMTAEEINRAYDAGLIEGIKK